MTAEYNNDVIKHTMAIQKFDWIEGKYTCIYGWWCFGYLDEKDREDAIVGMDTALNDDGFLIFFESVTRKDE